MANRSVKYSNHYTDLSRKELAQVMEQTLSKRRYKHVMRVEKTALYLAEKYNVDKEKVSIAAIAHDYAKERSDEEMMDLIISENQDLEMLQFGSNIWHGPIGAVLLRNEFNIADDEILEAIKYHTIGAPKMSQVAQIIYIADFIEPNRSFKGVDKARKLSEVSLAETLAFISKHTLENLIKRNMKVYPKSIETYNAWAVSYKEENNDPFVY
ncbi:MAG: bis(5'-nucleosyl)-tetraphosphatase (symmetrical) YqeK [Alkalibacterium sp.]|nr:bis(5'-nucleosyl)-tetraphosphatase (symmetrical) YqeK [Alkalibacterium sp.]TVP92368.1 MAG: HD domain-containing protein [Alkalibacterium sp.]